MGQLTKVGITGQGGFMGKHLYNFLGTKTEEVKRIEFKREYFENNDDLQNFVKECDVIVHIAAMNRHEDPQVIYDTNLGLVEKLVEACKTTNSTPQLTMSPCAISPIKNDVVGTNIIVIICVYIYIYIFLYLYIYICIYLYNLNMCNIIIYT